jgi:hypothetical protein
VRQHGRGSRPDNADRPVGFYLDTEVADRAFELRVAQGKLDRAQVLGSSIDQRRLGAADGMGSVSGRIKTNFLDPGIHNSSILSGARMNAAWEEEVVRRKT